MWSFGHRTGRARRSVIRRLGAALALVAGFAAGPAAAATDWLLVPDSSTLTYQSIKKNSIVETNAVRNLSGIVTAGGEALVTIDLNSVDTGVDIRNVRMRFLFFETFKFPAASLTARIDPAVFADLKTKRRLTMPLPFRLNLHGVEKDLTADVVVTMVTDTMVSVASRAPVSVAVADFDLLPGLEKLKEAAEVDSIVPSASVSFDLIFAADDGTAPPAVAAAPSSAPGAATPAPAASIAAAAPAAAAAAPAVAGPVVTDAARADFSDEECLNRFEVLSRTGAVYFATASARLDPESGPLLRQVLDVVGKCPRLGVEVAGHTDSDGPADENQRLSERRAAAVADFLATAGVPSGQVSVAGYGETRPIAGNDSARGKALNRRIEFVARPLGN
ncbi:OmpA family protein [Methylobrevis albus]|uniref:OmpA family protein n=1 Tax=Methylobrevis albus TaxID=2793297 RepID=A0A931I0M5_9HYPH|nr:OmpA family protein [Methylobrevis albus]MBH0237552.1 OmpA family protein [Methylobrevis albus]